MKEVTVYTDGASKGNPGPGGYGAVLLHGRYRRELYDGFECTTNNRMELMAVIAALEALNEPCKITLFSDSKYVIQALSDGWIEGWKKKNWSRGKDKPLKNVDLWKRLDSARRGHQVNWRWVKGHAGNAENERCDELANEGCYSSKLKTDSGFSPERIKS